MEYRKGDVVKVWSLQSFFGGGFLNGVEGIVSQDQHYDDSVLVSVSRKIKGKRQIDPSYEVYPAQLELVARAKPELLADFDMLIAKVKDLKS